MSDARLLVDDGATGYYHCVSRVVNRDFIFGDKEKEFFVKTLRKLEVYCGVRVLTHCAMSNHFHVLVEVPDKIAAIEKVTEIVLLDRVQTLYGLGRRREVELQLEMARKSGSVTQEQAVKEQYLASMGELRHFMKMLKQRFTVWYNRRHGRKGTLWEERYKSVMVEGDYYALIAVAAYIDLNPVRAKIVSDPKDYRWSGYGQSVAGVKESRRGLARIYELHGESVRWNHVGSDYLQYVYRATEIQPGSKSAVAEVIAPEKVKEVVTQGGKLPLADVLRVKVRYFSDGLVLGSKEFVDGVFEGNRQRFGEKRKSGARRMRGGDWGELRVMRDLRVDVVGTDLS
jgi:REP element-mobilizing transposase RayT